MKNGIKQLFRTPGKVLLFFLLMAAAASLLVLGASLLGSTTAKINAVENSFTTIGMVEQRPSGYQDIELSPEMQKAMAEHDTQIPTGEPIFDEIFTTDVLDFEGANYVLKPEKRPYYGAWVPDLFESGAGNQLNSHSHIFEFTPIEEYVPNQPVKVQVERVLLGTDPGDTLYICDHFAKNPEPWEMGKTYIVSTMFAANTHAAESAAPFEYMILEFPGSGQRDADGNLLESPLSNTDRTPPYREVTAGFYEQPEGRYWLNLVESREKIMESVAVLPVRSLTLLQSFHADEVFLSGGREITEEEFLSGAKVCMVPDGFFRQHKLAVGDKITLPLFYANYSTAAHAMFAPYDDPEARMMGFFDMLTAQGEAYDSFFEAEYEIVGTYNDRHIYSAQPYSIEIGIGMFLIPKASVTASDENNIVTWGPMLKTTTSFQIPNGTMDAYMQALSENVPESAQLDITFDDGGYSVVIGSLNNMRAMAVILFAVGLFAALAVLILLLYFFIVQQRRRTAIERSLGMTKRGCRVSLVTGVVLLAAVATATGAAVSTALLDRVEKLDLTGQGEAVYSTDYSMWSRGSEVELPEEIAGTGGGAALVVGLSVAAGLILLTALLSVLLVNQSLKIEPILLLGGRE